MSKAAWADYRVKFGYAYKTSRTNVTCWFSGGWSTTVEVLSYDDRPINWGSAARTAFERFKKFNTGYVGVITLMESDDGTICDERSITEDALKEMV